ncbi:uncharacterized protein AKAW2_21052A [Aspergillus luchuensis]|uniref:Uncharacterized protein n=1 Tax=Aspergillus kawachii TaxID=1069201 RepID=A0A7R7W498_ASPKA|nr:uncharacterized protein AKAW2_21052A [Aspergillus luchuensis]BCR96112.1 hypothetical protein AKAW2_21052A [Aspergillus luchuensis]
MASMGSYISNIDDSLSFNRRIIQNISSERGEGSVSDIGETNAELCARLLPELIRCMLKFGHFLLKLGQFRFKILNFLAELINF